MGYSTDNLLCIKLWDTVDTTYSVLNCGIQYRQLTLYWTVGYSTYNLLCIEQYRVSLYLLYPTVQYRVSCIELTVSHSSIQSKLSVLNCIPTVWTVGYSTVQLTLYWSTVHTTYSVLYPTVEQYRVSWTLYCIPQYRQYRVSTDNLLCTVSHSWTVG